MLGKKCNFARCISKIDEEEMCGFQIACFFFRGPYNGLPTIFCKLNLCTHDSGKSPERKECGKKIVTKYHTLLLILRISLLRRASYKQLLSSHSSDTREPVECESGA